MFDLAHRPTYNSLEFLRMSSVRVSACISGFSSREVASTKRIRRESQEAKVRFRKEMRATSPKNRRSF
jgi:hypothetical protein